MFEKIEPFIFSMEDIEAKEVEWLWQDFIPLGKVTILQGDPGEGKTTAMLQIIASLTTGRSIISDKDDPPIIEPCNVIYQTAEDGLADTIKPRLIAAGADCSRVKVIDDIERPLTLLDERLEAALIKTEAKWSSSIPYRLSSAPISTCTGLMKSAPSWRVLDTWLHDFNAPLC